MIKNASSKRVDKLVLFLLPLLAVGLSIAFEPNFFVSILLFLGLPALYISVRCPQCVLKSVLFSLIASLPLMLIIEYIGGPSQAWAFPPSIFSYYLLGRVSIEVLFWALLNIYAVVIFYEYMFEHHKRVAVWNKKMWVLVYYLMAWTALFLILLIVSSGTVVVPYFYLLFGLAIFIFPIVIAWCRYPKVLPKMAHSLLYFSYLSLLYELTALSYGWWYFPGKDFIGHISLFHLSFPIEEFLFWIILFAPAVISAFEYLDDDCK